MRAQIHDLAEELAELAKEHNLTVAVAESLTAGRLAAELGAASDSAEWFRGGVVAYAADVKHELLGVPDVPVVSATAATSMAAGVRALMHATVAVAVTGVGGPDEQDGKAPGSVWFAVAAPDQVEAFHCTFEGTPSEVLDQTIVNAVQRLLAVSRSTLSMLTPGPSC